MGKVPNNATHVQQLRATNDVNGNPRRVWVFTAPGGADWAHIVAVVDEGYAGRPREARGLVELPSFVITPKQYRELVRQGRALAKGDDQ